LATGESSGFGPTILLPADRRDTTRGATMKESEVMICVGLVLMGVGVGVMINEYIFKDLRYNTLLETNYKLQIDFNQSKSKYNSLVFDLCSSELLDSYECGAYIRMVAKDCDGTDKYRPLSFRGKELYFKYNCKKEDSGWVGTGVHVYKKEAQP
jgi:hypothetical protein